MCSTGDCQSTMTVYIISGAMASGDSRGWVRFRDQLAPESIVALDSPGVVVVLWDTKHVPDVSVYGHVMTTRSRHECCMGGPRTVFGF